MRLFSLFFPFFGVVCSLVLPGAFANQEPLAAAFQKPKMVKGKSKPLPVLNVPNEYGVYFKAKAALKGKTTLASLGAIERELLLEKLSADNRALDKDLEELFYALEIKRGTQFALTKSWASSLSSFQRALNGLPQFKWIYYWAGSDSIALSKVCSRNKKVKDETCLSLAKRISDVFPKAALETKVLRDLPMPDLAPANDNGVDRLTQTYSEKIEKDEEAFQEVLQNYLNGKDSDLLKSAEEFTAKFPKSALRFRANFLIAEMYTRKGSKDKVTALYQSIIDDIPLSFYAIVSAERLGINLVEKVKKDPILIDSAIFNPNLAEKQALDRAKALFSKKHYDEVGIELDSLSRMKNYSTDFLLYLMRFGFDSNQNLFSFKCASELIQRKYGQFLNDEMIGMIFPDRFLAEVDAAAKQTKVDPLLILSLTKQESGFKAPIISSSGALGLMQLMPFTAVDTKKDIVLSSLKDPASNVSVGTTYLASLLQKYDGNIPFALAAYNAGPHRVAKWQKDAKAGTSRIDWIEAIPFKETREYVMAILRNRFWYQYRRGLVPDKVIEVSTH